MRIVQYGSERHTASMSPLMLKAMSSMATRQVLNDLSASWNTPLGNALEIESLGGVTVAERVRSGEILDLVFLAHDALSLLADEGHVQGATLLPLMRSSVAVALPAGHPAVVWHHEDELREAVMGARSIAYSTGPSGAAVLALFERWGIRTVLADRLVQASPGVPVAQCVAQGLAAMGFQQLSEILHVPGVRVQQLPPGLHMETCFSGALTKTCTDPDRCAAARAVLKFFASEQAEGVRQAHGMQAP